MSDECCVICGWKFEPGEERFEGEDDLTLELPVCGSCHIDEIHAREGYIDENGVEHLPHDEDFEL